MTSIRYAAVALVLAACGQESGEAARYDAPPPREFTEAAPAAADEITVTGSKRSAPPPEEPSGGEMLAYAYEARLELPAEAVGAFMEADRDACAAAGSDVCQVLSASVNAQREDTVFAQLRFRAAPDYMAGFRASLADDAEGAGGRLVATEQSVEDLTRRITDLSARLDAQRTLRDRLTALLERQDGDVGDLLQVERELARVQGEIESMTSQLTYLRGRVSMNLMTVRYDSIYEAIGRERARPLADAFRDFFGILAESLASLIRFFALALPWLVIGLPLLLLLLRPLRRLRRRRKGRAGLDGTA